MKIFTDEIILFAYQSVKNPSEIVVGLISTKKERIGFKVLGTYKTIEDLINKVNEEKKSNDIAFCTTNSTILSRFLKDKANTSSKTFRMFLNAPLEENDRILRYSIYTNSIIGTKDKRVETLRLGVNLTIQDTSATTSYMIDYSSIKTYTIALMDYIYYRTTNANIDRISSLNK